jgi:hypothetical protein
LTVSTTSIKNSAAGNGSTTAFTYTFKAFASSEIKVFIRTDSTGAEAQRSEGSGSTNYSVSGVGSATGGTVTFVTAPASGETVVIRRQTAQTQGTDYVENDPFPAEDHETALDKLTHIVQEQQEEHDRAFKVSKTNSITTPEFSDDASARASKLLGFSSDGNSLEATTGRVSAVTVSNVAVSGGTSQSATVSFNTTTGALALGIPVGSTGATGATGSAAVFSEIASQAEAEAGTNNVKGMTALRTKQAVDEYGLLASNNLSDLAAASTARTNLGLGTAAVLTAGTSANNAVQLTGAAALPAVSGASLTGVGLTGVHQIWVPAVAISPTATGGAEAYSSTNSSGPDLTGLKFDGSSEEAGDFSIAAFNSLKTSATMTFTPYWISDASTNGCVWGFKAVAVADGEDINAASFGTEVTSADTAQSSATELLKGPASGACTVAGLGAAGELIYVRVSRKVSNGSDTISGDTTLIGILIALETDAGNDS